MMIKRAQRFIPRPYQEKAVREVLALHRAGNRKMLLHLPTGSGKTVIATLIIERLLSSIRTGKILFIAHRKELLQQTAEKISYQIPALTIGLEQGSNRADANAQMIIASIQSLTHRKNSYTPEEFALIICDECHHALAPSWVEVINYFHDHKNQQALLLGMTATPRRTDGRSALHIFDNVAFEISKPELQDLGYLVPIHYWAFKATLSLDKVKMSSGDFQVASLTEVMNSKEVRALTLGAWEAKGKGKKTLVFCASVKHAYQLAADFTALGYRSEVIEGRTKNRETILERFRQGELDLLLNYGVLTEGYDDPSIECLLLARPTTSPLVYNQCLGRGLRPSQRKDHCTVIDIVDRSTRQLQYGACQLADLPRGWNTKGRDPFRESRAIAQIKITDPNAFLAVKQASSLEEVQDLLMQFPPEIVLAGLDGEEVPRYQPARERCTDKEAEKRVRTLLSQAGALVKKVSQDAEGQGEKNGAMRVSLVAPEVNNEKFDYLKWHLARSTGWEVQFTPAKTPRGRKPNPKALLRSMLPQESKIEKYEYEEQNNRIVVQISGLPNDSLEQVRTTFQNSSGIELDVQGQLSFGF